MSIRLHHEMRDEPIVKRLRALAKLGGDLEPIAQAIAFEGEQAARRRFAEEVDPEGEPWPDSIRKRERGGKTLTHSGQLAGSLTSEAHGGRAEWGTNKPYARIHQKGGKIEAKGGGYLHFPLPGGGWVRVKSVTMPRRAFLGVSPEDEAAFEDIAAMKLRAAAERGRVQ